MKQFFQTGKPILKITAAVLLVLAAASLVGAATYAWHILSVAPEAGGMQITIGAAKVIQVAPDVAAADGSHTPGTFGDTLDITKDANYDYLNGLAGLTPVSTADGVHWYLPQYGDAADGTYHLTVRICGGSVRVSESDCPGQDCVRTGSISRAGQSIVCLPAQVVISLESAASEVDVVLG